MLRIMGILAALAITLNSAYSYGWPFRTEKGLTIFVVQTDFAKPVIKQHAELIARRVSEAEPGEAIHLIDTTGESVLAFELDDDMNRLEQNQARIRARKRLRDYFITLLREEDSDAESVTVDVAQAIHQAMDRFNFSSANFTRRVLVLMTDGLQHTDFSWRGGLPSDSFIQHLDSPFAAVPAADAKSDVPVSIVMLSTLGRYIDASHGELIKRWYALFFSVKKAQLVAFSYDHKAVETLLIQGGPFKPLPTPEPEQIDGPLVFEPFEPLID